MSETKTAGANFILSFYNDIMLLTDEYGRYYNIRIEVSSSQELTKDDDDVIDKNGNSQLNEEQVSMLKNSAHNIRFMINKVMLQYGAIVKKLKMKNDQALIDKTNEVLKQYVPKVNDTREVCILLNEFLVDNVIQDLLGASNSILENG